MAAAPHAPRITAKQHAADVANLKKARAALKGRPRTARQRAASRRNLAIGRAAQKARASGKTPAPRKAPQVPAPADFPVSRTMSLLALPVCGPLAVAEHLRAVTGALADIADILELWDRVEGSTIGDLLEAVKEHGLAGERLSYFERADPDADVPGLLYGICLSPGRYHVAVGIPGGLISWCRVVPREGTPEEAWWLEWEGE